MPPAPSTAQVRWGQSAAHSSSLAAWRDEARTLTSPSGTSAASIATAVWDALCGSTPIITTAIRTTPFSSSVQVTAQAEKHDEPGGHV
jgi:hypothetical protein